MKNLLKLSGGLLLCLFATNAFGASEDRAAIRDALIKKYSFKAHEESSVVQATIEMDRTNKSSVEKSAALQALFAEHPEALPAVEYMKNKYFKVTE